MGGTPLTLYLGVGIPAAFSSSQVEAFLDGIFAGLTKYDLALAGGDTCRSKGSLMISITVQGSAPRNRAITRSGATSGEDLWVSGTLGDSALALHALEQNCRPSAFLAERHFRPEARVKLGECLLSQRLATAMLDLSDGLCGDLGHLMTSSGVGARVNLEQLPLSAEFCTALQGEPGLIDLALCGGEDYELLFTAKTHLRVEIDRLAEDLHLSLRRIGEVTSGTELKLCLSDGQDYHPKLAAFDHFSSPRVG